MDALAGQQVDKKALIKWAVTLALTGLCLVIPSSENYTSNISVFLAITVFSMLLMAFELVPIFVPAVIMPVMYMVCKVAPQQVVFGAWMGQVPWVLIGSMVVASIMEKTGLSKRIAYRSLLMARGNFTLLLMAFLAAGTIIAAFVPAGLARVALMCTIMYSICSAMGWKANSKYALIGFSAAYFIGNDTSVAYLTGSNATIILGELLGKSGHNVTWVSYAFYNLVPAVLYIAMQIFAIQWYCRKHETGIADDGMAHNMAAHIREEYEKLGPASHMEKKAMLLVSVIVLLLLTGSLHPLNAGQVFTLMAALAFFPGLNLANADDAKKINFPMVLLIVACVSIGDVASAIGAGKAFVSGIISYVPDNVYGLVALNGILAFLGNFVMTPMALVAGFTVPVIEIAGVVGADPLGVTMLFFLACMAILLPYESTTTILMYSYGMMSMREFIKIFAIKCVVTFVAMFTVFLGWYILVGII